MFDIKVLILGLVVALIIGVALGYAAMPEKRITFTSTTLATTTLTSTVTTTRTRTLTSTFTTTRTLRETVTVTSTPKEQETSTQTPTETSPTQTTPQPETNSVLCFFSDYSGTSKVKLEVLKVVRGESAKDAVKYANMFNKKAPEGYEYILVDVRITLLSGERFPVNPLYDFKVESEGRLVRPEWIVYPKNMPRLESAELLPGGSASGWLAFIIPEGSSAWLHLEPLLKESSGVCWVNLGP